MAIELLETQSIRLKTFDKLFGTFNCSQDKTQDIILTEIKELQIYNPTVGTREPLKINSYTIQSRQCMYFKLEPTDQLLKSYDNYNKCACTELLEVTIVGKYIYIQVHVLM